MGPLLTTGSAPLCTSDIWKNIIQKTSSKGRSTHQTTFTFFWCLVVCIKNFESQTCMFQIPWIPYTNQPCSMWCCPDVEQLRTRDGREYRSVTTFPRSGVGEGCGAMRGGHTTGLRGGWINRAQTEIGKAIQKKTEQKVIWHPKKNWMVNFCFCLLPFPKSTFDYFPFFSCQVTVLALHKAESFLGMARTCWQVSKNDGLRWNPQIGCDTTELTSCTEKVDGAQSWFPRLFDISFENCHLNFLPRQSNVGDSKRPSYGKPAPLANCRRFTDAIWAVNMTRWQEVDSKKVWEINLPYKPSLGTLCIHQSIRKKGLQASTYILSNCLKN